MESTDRGSGSAHCRSPGAYRPRQSGDARGHRHGTIRYPGEPLSVDSDGTPGAHAGDARPAAAKTVDNARCGPPHRHGTVATLGTQGPGTHVGTAALGCPASAASAAAP